MDIRISKSLFLAVLVLLPFAEICGAPAADPLEISFLNPPDSARPHTWWHWLDGNVSKEGITKDLEAMKAVGIGGFQQFDAGLAFPAGRLKPFLCPPRNRAAVAGKRHARRHQRRLEVSPSAMAA